MLISTEHLVPGMKLDKDIELKAGSYLITRHDLGNGLLTEKVIESIKKFGDQIVPVQNRVFIKDDKIALGYVKKVLDEDLRQIAKGITTGKDYPNFLADGEIQAKVMRVTEILFSNPNIIRIMYDVKFNTSEQAKPLDLILEHSIRTTLLSVALGLRLRWTILSLVSIGTAALMHDMGILTSPLYSDLETLDELSSDDLSHFIEKHQALSARLFQDEGMAINPVHQREIFHIIANHHNPDSEDLKHRNTLLLHFADLLDEMISLMPHSLRYNFSSAQLELLGERYKRRCGLVNALLGLTRLYKHGGGLAWEIVSNLAGLFMMKELLGGDFDLRLQEIIDRCPFDSAKANPPLDGNSLPHTIYCSKSNEEGFLCEHLLYVKTAIQDDQGNMKEYLKCEALGPRLQKLIEKGES